MGLASDAEGALEGFLSSPRFTFGKWCGAADLAARARQTSFFETKLTTSFLDRAARLGLADEDVEAMRRVAALTSVGLGGAELQELQEILRAIIVRNSG